MKFVIKLFAVLILVTLAVVSWVFYPGHLSAANYGPWEFTITEGGGGWIGTPVCTSGENATDLGIDNLVVDPRAGGFFQVHLKYAADHTKVFTRSKVKITPSIGEGLADDWYVRLPSGVVNGSPIAASLGTLEQSWAFNFTGATDQDLRNIGSIPAVGRAAEWVIHTNFALNKQGSVVASCDIRIRVWAAGDPAIPGNAVVAKNVSHVMQHMHHELSLNNQFRVFKYPTGPFFPEECDGHDNNTETTDQGVQGEFRLEPDVGGGGPAQITGDLWALNNYGGNDQFNWRFRSGGPNVSDNHDLLPTGNSDLMQGGQRWSVFLPGGGVVQDHQPVEWIFTGHTHTSPNPNDQMGDICESRVIVS